MESGTIDSLATLCTAREFIVRLFLDSDCIYDLFLEGELKNGSCQHVPASLSVGTRQSDQHLSETHSMDGGARCKGEN